ncbi:MAG: DUF3240 family protein [Methylococcales bacterium]
MSAQEYLVTLNVPPGIEGSIVDRLLLLEVERGFSSFPVSAHHHLNSGLTLTEQVTGRHKEIRFQIYVPAEGLADLLAQLRQEFSGANIHYWVLPIIEQGVI